MCFKTGISTITAVSTGLGWIANTCRKSWQEKCLKMKDPTCAIILKSMGFKDTKYDIPVYQI